MQIGYLGGQKYITCEHRIIMFTENVIGSPLKRNLEFFV